MEYVQIGLTALRGPNGNFCTQVPMYVKTEDLNKLEAKADMKSLSQYFGSKLSEGKEVH